MQPAHFLPPVIAFLALCSAGQAQKLGSVPKLEPSTKAPKGEVLEWTSPAGQPYWYRLPKKAKGKPALILMLHGTGGNHGWSFWNYPIASGAFRKNDIVISPDGVTPGANKTFNFTQSAPDGDQLVSIIKTFRRNFDIGKVYVYGHSQGAFFAYWFAGAYPEIVDGIVAHAGNVLNVRHSKLAKKKIGIAILHGLADAVVPASCAERSHKIYQDAGYQKLKLKLVDGLTARSGHWPLPTQVSEMMSWLDSVTANTAPSSVAAALSALGRDTPDFLTARDCVQRAGKLIKKVKGKEREQLQQRLDALQGLFAEAAAKHATALSAMNPKVAEDAEWIEHFRIAHSIFAEQTAWKQPMKALISRAKKDEKRAQRALKAMNRKWNKASFRLAKSTAESALLAASHGDLLRQLAGRVEHKIKGVQDADRAAVTALALETKQWDEKGATAATEALTTSATAFVEAHPSWFSDQ